MQGKKQVFQAFTP